MRRLFFLPIIVFFALLQASVLDYFKFFGVKPDLLLAAAAGAGLVFTPGWALLFSLLCGLLKDIYSAGPFYINAFLFPLWSILIIKLSRKVSLDYGPARMGAAFTAALLQNILCWLALISLGKGIPLGISARITLISSLYTAFVFPLVFKCCQIVSFRMPVQGTVSPQDE